MAGGPPKGREGKGGVTRARAALIEGDYRRAHLLAEQTLADASASEADKADAASILDATRIDRAPIIAGILVLLVLLGLFAWVYVHGHAG